jgi:FSR family fosmidomycin resistance protein-like MFS transporter
VFHPEAPRVARVAAGGRYGLAQSLFQVGGNLGSATGPLLAAFIVVPAGQRSVVWFSAAALLGMFVLFQVGRWYAARRGEGIVVRTKARGRSPRRRPCRGAASPWPSPCWWCFCSARMSTAPASAPTTPSA